MDTDKRIALVKLSSAATRVIRGKFFLFEYPTNEVKEKIVKKIIMLLAVVLLFSAPDLSEAFAPRKGDKPCIECHKLDKSKAAEIIIKIIPNGKVLDIKPAPFKGAWLIEVEKDGQRGGVFLDFSKKYLIGQILPLDQVGKPAPQRHVDVSKIPLDNAIRYGSRDATKKIIVFTDPDCPYCRELHKIMARIIAKRKDIAFDIILIPLPMHKDAYKKSQAVQCAKSTELLDDAFSGKPVPEPACPADAIEKNKAAAQALEFNGTPTLVRDDGLVLSGYLPEEKLIDWIDKKQ
jgi:thiol:disulfide interchange protein DsbC